MADTYDQSQPAVDMERLYPEVADMFRDIYMSDPDQVDNTQALTTTDPLTRTQVPGGTPVVQSVPPANNPEADPLHDTERGQTIFVGPIEDFLLAAHEWFHENDEENASSSASTTDPDTDRTNTVNVNVYHNPWYASLLRAPLYQPPVYEAPTYITNHHTHNTTVINQTDGTKSVSNTRHRRTTNSDENEDEDEDTQNKQLAKKDDGPNLVMKVLAGSVFVGVSALGTYIYANWWKKTSKIDRLTSMIDRCEIYLDYLQNTHILYVSHPDVTEIRRLIRDLKELIEQEQGYKRHSMRSKMGVTASSLAYLGAFMAGFSNPVFAAGNLLLMSGSVSYGVGNWVINGDNGVNLAKDRLRYQCQGLINRKIDVKSDGSRVDYHEINEPDPVSWMDS